MELKSCYMNKLQPVEPKRLNIVNVDKIKGYINIKVANKGVTGLSAEPYKIVNVDISDDFYIFQCVHELTNNSYDVKLRRNGSWEFNDRLGKYTFFYSFFNKPIKVSADYIKDMENLKGSIASYLEKENS